MGKTPLQRSWMKMMFLGAPGVGKGTYANLLGPHYRVPVLSSGSLVRAEIKAGTEIGMMAKEINDKGDLISDDVMIEMVSQTIQNVNGGYILDGFPRTLPQAEALHEVQELDLVINFTLPESILLQKTLARRMCATCGRGYNLADINDGVYVMPPMLPNVESICDDCSSELIKRSDDTESTILNRLQVYSEQTAPLVEFYRKKGTLIEFPIKKGLDDFPELLEVCNEYMLKKEHENAE